MNIDDESTGARESATGLERELHENTVEYLLFVTGKKNISFLEEARREAIKLLSELTSEYIWQREEFNLEMRHDKGR
jgi:hypothetical protein